MFNNVWAIWSLTLPKPTRSATLSACSFDKPCTISIGSYKMASGFSAATSSMLTPPWDDAIMTGP